MTAETEALPRQRAESRDSLLNDPAARSIAIQVLLIAALVAFTWWIVDNTATNLRNANMVAGFDFLGERAGFDIAMLPIDYSSNATYGRAILVGLINTIIVSVSGIVFATILGFVVGIGRLSRNFIVRGLSTVFVETFRNIPPLLVILFWYFGVLSVLGAPRNLQENPLGFYLTNRGLQMPAAVFGASAWMPLAAFAVGLVALFFVSRANRARQMATGETRKILWPALGLLLVFPLGVFFLTGDPITFDAPQATRFNLVGGWQVKPEFLALFLALSIYTAAFIAEIVRAGIMSVSKGQTEAASALGLRRGQSLRLVIVPQAFRVIIPPLTSQYLNLTKNSSLGLAVGYPELVAVGNTVLNQSGHSIEVVMIWMCVYLGISLVVSIGMNLFNARMALAER